MDQNVRFSVYNHRLVIQNELLINRKFIVLKNIDGSLIFTDFHKYIKSNNQTVRNITDDGNNRFDFVVKLLNYAFFERGIPSLDKMTVDIVKDYLNGYGMGILPNDKAGRTKSTVLQCIKSIMDFLELFIQDRKQHCSIKIEDLYKWVSYRDKHGSTRKKKVPVFDVVYTNKNKTIFRDIPNFAFEMLFSHIAEYHKEILMLVTLSSFAGLRPSEACNTRREDSPLGSGLFFSIYDQEVIKVQIDLRKELCLRSDLKKTGGIKKERVQTVPLMFTEAFIDSYNNYLSYLEGNKFEKDYGALTVNKQGKAMTYQSYYQKFTKIIKEEMIPLYLACDDAETVIYGQLLLQNNLSPHVFRHWYTVQLVLAGMDNPAELMEARGDTSPESALTYLQNKGELEKQYRKVNNEMFSYLSWAATKKQEERGIK